MKRACFCVAELQCFSPPTAVAAKAPRKSLPSSQSAASPSSSGTKKKAKGAVGGNSLKIWPAPKWQKNLHQFLGIEQGGSGGACGESSSSSSSANTSLTELTTEAHMDVGVGSSSCQDGVEGSSSSGAGTSSGLALLGGDIAQLNSEGEEED